MTRAFSEMKISTQIPTQGECHLKTKAENGNQCLMCLQAKEAQGLPANYQKPREKCGADSPPTALRRNPPAGTLTLDFQPVRNKFLLFTHSGHSMVLCYSSPVWTKMRANSTNKGRETRGSWGPLSREGGIGG